MGRIVELDTGYQTVSVVQDFAEIKAAATQAFLVHSVVVMQSSEEDVSPINEVLKIDSKRAGGSFTSGSGGGTLTVFKNNSGDAAHGLSAVESNNTTQAVVGTGTLENIPLMCGSFNVNAGEWERTPPPEIRPMIGPSEAFILALSEAPADAITMRAVIIIEILVG